jgi:hypothetical protein
MPNGLSEKQYTQKTCRFSCICKSKRTAMRVFKELKASGLLVEEQRGGMRYRGDGERVGVATTWRIAFYSYSRSDNG